MSGVETNPSTNIKERNTTILDYCAAEKPVGIPSSTGANSSPVGTNPSTEATSTEVKTLVGTQSALVGT